MKIIALVNDEKDLYSLAEGTFVLDSKRGIMVQGSYDSGKMLYQRRGNELWGIPLEDTRVENNNSVSIIQDFWCKLNPNTKEYHWAEHLLRNAPLVNIKRALI